MASGKQLLRLDHCFFVLGRFWCPSVLQEFCSSSSLMMTSFASTVSLQTILVVLLVGIVFHSAIISHLESGLVILDGSQ